MTVRYSSLLARTIKFIAFSSMLFAVSGCDAQTPPNVATGSQIKIETSKVPARYTAALPSTISGMQTWSNGSEKFPPLAHVVDNLAFGEPDMFRRLVTASKLIAAFNQAVI